MTFRFLRFDNLFLPLNNPVHPLITGESPRALFPLASGGMYDPLGDEQAPRGETPISIRCTIVDDDPASFETTMRAWRGKRGRRGKLYRRWEGTGKLEWAYADLRSISGDRGVNNGNNQELQINFVVQSPIWYGWHHGGGWLLDDGHYLDDGYTLNESDSYDLTADGIALIAVGYAADGSQPNVRISILNQDVGILPGGGIDITRLAIKIGPNDPFVPQSSWVYDNVIPPGSTLVIDTGLRRVTLDGVGDYAHFTIVDAEQLTDSWLRFYAPDSQEMGIRVEMTGGLTYPPATITFDFWGANE